MGHNDHGGENGFDEIGTFICTDCVMDRTLAGLVSDNLESDQCSYCEAESEVAIAAPFGVIMERIYTSILVYYADAQDIGIPYDRGWVFPETEPQDILDKFDPGWEWTLFDAILNCMGCDKYWVPHSQGDWGLANPAEALESGWYSFTDTVLYKTRYLFLSEPDDGLDADRPDHIPVRYVLETLANLTKRLGLITLIPSDTACYRVRASVHGKVYSEFPEISVPPKGEAGAGRMNPAGIPYLYVALDETTAVQETMFEQERPYALASMNTKASLRVLNLSNLPDIPGVFEPEKYEERHELLFLYGFTDEISKQIVKDGKEHIDYIPAQIVSEYFRHRYFDDGGKIDGVMFNSSKNEGGINIALFVSEHNEVEEIMSLFSIQMIG